MKKEIIYENKYNLAKDVKAWRKKHKNKIYTFDRKKFMPNQFKNVKIKKGYELQYVEL